jgi:hypothetical protein
MSLRMLAALAVLVSGAVHLYLYFDVFSDQHVIGPSFLLNAAGAVVIAVLLLRWRHWLPPLLSVGFGAATLGAFVIAATAGLFGVHEHWTGWPVFTAAISEVVAIAAGVAILARERGASGGQLQDGLAGRGAHLH